MASFDFDIGILGGGAAGLTVASGSAQLGAKTLLIEKEPVLGGDCLHYGCVPSKTLIKSAHVYHQMRNADHFGLPSLDLPPVDFSKIAARIAEVIATIQVHDSVERFCGLGAKVEFGNAEFVDEHSVRLGGKTVSAATWVVATGSSPVAPLFKGLDRTPYITNKEVFSLKRLPASLIVLGGGPIACEMAQAFARLGSHVEVVQRSNQILSKEDKNMANMVMDAMAREGVVFHLGASVIEIRDEEGTREVEIELGNGDRRTVRGDTLLVALGRQPNVEGLKLENAGVKPGQGGLDVDARMRTGQKHIFAAGDVTGRYQFTHAAGYEGGIVISNAVFHLPRKADYTNLPWCTYTWPELASVGLNEKRARLAGLDVEVYTESFSTNDRALAENETEGGIKLLLAKGKPVGVQIAGPHAGELISEWVAAQAGGVKLSAIAGAMHPYPTLAEINKRVVGNYLGPKIFSNKIRGALGFFFNYKGNACTMGDDGK